MTNQVATKIRTISDEEIFIAHCGGKLEVALTTPLENQTDLSIAYTPGVAKVCEAIIEDPSKANVYTWSSRLVAIVTDGSAVLGLGDIGGSASLPVMEGKAALFKKYADVNAIPLVVDSNDVDQIVETVKLMSLSFGAVNLEDISAPRCFEIEERLIEELDMPVMHDDQHGTAVVTLAALINSAKYTDRDIHTLNVVISGAGAAGIAIADILLECGIDDVILVDSKGVIDSSRQDLTAIKAEYAAKTNPRGVNGPMSNALVGADVFIGVSSGELTETDLHRMSGDAVVFALSNPIPEIDPDVAREYARVVATGRSDFPNQINNVLAFPGIFRGALDSGAKRITKGMKIAAAEAIAALVGSDLNADYVIPSVFDSRVAEVVATTVAAQALQDQQ